MYAAMLATPLRVARGARAGTSLAVAGHLVVATTIFVAVARRSSAGSASWWALLAHPRRGAHRDGVRRADLRVHRHAATADDGFNILFRFVITPLMLFSGTFFPIDQLPGVDASRSPG